MTMQAPLSKEEYFKPYNASRFLDQTNNIKYYS